MPRVTAQIEITVKSEKTLRACLQAAEAAVKAWSLVPKRHAKARARLHRAATKAVETLKAEIASK